MSLKEQLKKYKKTKADALPEDDFGIGYLDAYDSGFEDCLDLLYPLVEAHEENANQDYRGNREQASVNSFKVLEELREKLK